MPPTKFKPVTEAQLLSATSERLKALRGEMALEKVAKGAGVAPRGYFSIENGKALPNLRTLLRLANFHQLTIKDLLP